MTKSEILRIRMLCQIDNIAAINLAQSHYSTDCDEYASLQEILEGHLGVQRDLEEKMCAASVEEEDE